MCFKGRKRITRLSSAERNSEEMVDLVRMAGTMRADCLILNELTGAESFNFIEILRDGFTGIATISASNVFDAIKRLEFKAMMNSNFMGDVEELRYAICQAFDAIVFQERKMTAGE